VTDSKPDAILAAAAKTHAFQIGEWIHTGLPATSADLFEPVPTPPAPAASAPASAPAGSSTNSSPAPVSVTTEPVSVTTEPMTVPAAAAP